MQTLSGHPKHMKANLRDLQESFQAYLLGESNVIDQHIAAPTAALAHERLSIYGDAYVWRLLETLEKVFPTVRRLLGEDAFDDLGQAYLATHPSTHFSVALLGQHYSQFLSTMDNEQPFLAEVAEFEWQLSRVIDAMPDVEYLTIEDLQSIAPDAWGDLRFIPHPALHLIEQQWNTIAIYESIQRDQSILSPAMQNPKVCVMIWRKELEAHYRVLTSEQACALRGLMRGDSFAEICHGLCEFLPEEEVAGYMVGQLMQWLNQHLLVRDVPSS